MVPVASAAFVTSAIGFYHDETYLWLSIFGWTIFAFLHFWKLEKRILHILGVWVGGALVFSANDIWQAATEAAAAWWAELPWYYVAIPAAVVFGFFTLAAIGASSSSSGSDYSDDLGEKEYINAPFEAKDFLKKSGARWDAAARRWYVRDANYAAALELEVQERFGEKPARPAKAPEERLYAQVKFDDKELAKECGARWDPAQKAWYFTSADDLADFERLV